jgi:hypothetical protein
VISVVCVPSSSGAAGWTSAASSNHHGIDDGVQRVHDAQGSPAPHIGPGIIQGSHDGTTLSRLAPLGLPSASPWSELFLARLRARRRALCLTRITLVRAHVHPHVLALIRTELSRATTAGSRDHRSPSRRDRRAVVTLALRGTVTVRTGFAVGLLTIAIIDTGLGIAAADLPKVFDRFWRADDSRNRATGGSGLGLPIARKIAEAHGGDITVSSVPGAGTTFTVSLPSVLAPASAG